MGGVVRGHLAYLVFWQEWPLVEQGCLPPEEATGISNKWQRWKSRLLRERGTRGYRDLTEIPTPGTIS